MIFVILLCVLQLKSAVDAAAYILPPQTKPDKYACLEGCYVPDLDKVLPYNSTYSPINGNTCIQYDCGTDGWTGIYTCGAVGVPEGCTPVKGNLSLPYPNCCINSFTCISTTVEPETTTDIPETTTIETEPITEEPTTKKPKPPVIKPKPPIIKPGPPKCIYPPPRYVQDVGKDEGGSKVKAIRRPICPQYSPPIIKGPVEPEPITDPIVTNSPIETETVEKPDTENFDEAPNRVESENAPARCPPGMGCIDPPPTPKPEEI